MKSKVAVIPCQGYDEFKVNEAIKRVFRYWAAGKAP